MGRQITDFTLSDTNNVEHKLSGLADKPLVVVAFVGVECPLVQLYTGRLVALHEKLASRGVAFLAIDSNRQDDLREVEHYARTFEIPFPVLRDPAGEVAEAFGATRTPEVFVLDAERKVRYRGRIDDQYGIDRGVNFQRPKPTRHDLAAALDELLAGQQVSQADTAASGCLIGRRRPADADSPVTWSQQISRIFQRRCQGCHRPGEIGPFPLLTYDDVIGWDAMIAEVVSEGRMPPWHANPAYGEFLNDSRLTDEEKHLIAEWVAHGAPEGDRTQLPPPIQVAATEDSKPWDVELFIQDKPFEVPAEGVLDYQYFTVDPGFTEDKWVSAVEAHPDCRAVVHHMAVFIAPKGDFFKLRRQGKVSEIGGYVPGVHFSDYVGHPADASELPETSDDTGLMLIPAGSQVVFEMHYTASGRAQQDRTSVVMRFADPEVVARKSTGRFKSALAESTDFAIPKQASDYPVDGWYTFLDDSKILWLNSHMHLRGKSMRFEAHYPNGEREVLLDIPRYDFDWQTVYLLSRPKQMPKGTRLHCVAHFDNSADNLRNPDPDRVICYGHQTWQEMMAGTMGLVSTARDEPESADGSPLTTADEILAGYTPVEEVPVERRAGYYVQRALYREQRTDRAGAIGDLDRAIEQDAKLAVAWFERGRLHQVANDHRAALADLNQAIAIDSRESKYFAERGWAQFHLQNYVAAIGDFDAALDLSPRNQWAWYYRAVTRLASGDVPAAVAELEQLTSEINPGFLPGRSELAKVLLALGRDAEARAQWAAVLEVEPDRAAEVELKFATQRIQQGRFEEAKSHLNAILSSEPANAEARLTLAMVCFQQGEHAAGLEQLREIVRQHPDDVEARLRLARALSQVGDPAEALSIYREAQSKAPDNLDAANTLAWALATCPVDALRSGAEAVRLAEAVCEKTKRAQPSYLDTLAAALAEVGRFPDAVATADQAAKVAIKARNFPLAVDIQERRRIYRSGRSYRDAAPRSGGN
jgi:tetratricopeptide (TPR) repeat protein/peroxiredoxin